MADISVLRGDNALQQFEDTAFRAEWEDLYRACPWATIFQAIPFIEVWHNTYSDDFEPVVVLWRDGARLAGVLNFALEKGTSALVQCGHPQSEYGVWLTRPGEEGQFLAAALPAIWAAFPNSVLRLAFTPPDTPLGVLTQIPGAVVVPQPCGLRAASVESADASLRKSANKTKFKRLSAVGALELVELGSREALERHIDVIAQYCDLRQGGVNGDLPFQQDPRKREFFLRLAEIPCMLHSVALMVGDNLAAFHAGFVSRDREHIGLITHSPFLARHSPGKIMLLMLIKDLAKKGFAFLDLTPGGAYKERFQDSQTNGHAVTFFANSWQAKKYRLKLAARKTIRRLIVRAGIDPVQFQRKAAKIRPRSVARSVVNVARNGLKWSQEMRFYRLDEAAVPELQKARTIKFKINHIPDLLQYEQRSPTERTKQTFLNECIDRLEGGETIYTYAENGRLLHFAWMAEREAAAPSGLGSTVYFPPKSLVLWDDYTDPVARGRGLHKASIAARALDALATGAGVFMNVDADNTPSRKNIERAGFVYIGSVRRQGSQVWPEPATGDMLPVHFFGN